MSGFPHTSRANQPGDGMPAGEHGSHLTMAHTGPHRPEAGSPLERVLSRQSTLGVDRLLDFVPAQVR